MEQKKSIKLNALLNGLKTFLNMLFPLITFPYVSRVLQVEKLGEYNFANTFVGYFVLIAGLGISGYAIREGTPLRNDKKKFEKFAKEIFTISIISTILAYLCLALSLFFIDYLEKYFLLIILFSIQIVFNTIGVEWIYSIYEEYTYITIRSIVFKIVSVILIFLFVRNQDDVGIYAAITVFAVVGSNILNLYNSRKYCKLGFASLYVSVIKHLRPILILFASSVAVMIYVYSDTTILGLLMGDYAVGLYTVSSKVYTIVKELLSAILIVSIPRVAMLYGQKKYLEFRSSIQRIYDSLMILVIPSIVGILMLRNEIILFISDSNYLEASYSLGILSLALLFCFVGWIYNKCVLIPAKKEIIVFIATSVSALLNVILNFLLIPYWGEKAAALTTLFSEILMMAICCGYGVKICKIKFFDNNIFSALLGTMLVASNCFMAKRFLGFLSNKVFLFFVVISSPIIYAVCLLVLNNSIVKEEYNQIRRKLTNRMRKGDC